MSELANEHVHINDSAAGGAHGFGELRRASDYIESLIRGGIARDDGALQVDQDKCSLLRI